MNGSLQKDTYLLPEIITASCIPAISGPYLMISLKANTSLLSFFCISSGISGTVKGNPDENILPLISN